MCTTTRTKKIIVGLVLVNLLIIAIPIIFDSTLHFILPFSNVIVFVVLPVTVLVINLMVVSEMRRASNSAANLGLQLHQQPQSAVPTVMLVTTSLVYVLLQGPWVIARFIFHLQPYRILYAHLQSILFTLSHFVYSYNFYVYLITGKQFRSDLHTLFYRCSTCCSSSSIAAAHNRNEVELAERRQDDSDV